MKFLFEFARSQIAPKRTRASRYRRKEAANARAHHPPLLDRCALSRWEDRRRRSFTRPRWRRCCTINPTRKNKKNHITKKNQKNINNEKQYDRIAHVSATGLTARSSR